MSAASRRETQLPDLDRLDVQSLKALVLAKQAELDSRTTEIESLKLLIVKLKRMHFAHRAVLSCIYRGPKSALTRGVEGPLPGKSLRAR
jgi:hypothetical protein